MQHATDTDEAGLNDVQGKTDTYCTIPTSCLVMEHDSAGIQRKYRGIQSALLLYHKDIMLNVSPITQTIQSYHNYSRCCL